MIILDPKTFNLIRDILWSIKKFEKSHRGYPIIMYRGFTPFNAVCPGYMFPVLHLCSQTTHRALNADHVLSKNNN